MSFMAMDLITLTNTCIVLAIYHTVTACMLVMKFFSCAILVYFPL